MRYFFSFYILFFSLQPLFSKECKFFFDRYNSHLQWTAYKFTEKIGVDGTFSRFKVKNLRPSESIMKTVGGIVFAIDPASINTMNKTRDRVILRHFFGNLKGRKKIYGTFRNIYSDSAQLVLSMNKKKIKTPVKYSIIGEDQLEVSGTLDLTEWNAQKALHKLNIACTDTHKGKDGLSYLWPLVDFKVIAKFTKACK